MRFWTEGMEVVHSLMAPMMFQQARWVFHDLQIPALAVTFAKLHRLPE